MSNSRLTTAERRSEIEAASASWPSRNLGPEETDQLELYLRGALDETGVEAVDGSTILCDSEGVRLAALHPDGTIEGLQLPTRHDFPEFRKSPAEVAPSKFAYFAGEPILRAEFEALRAQKPKRLLILASSIGEGRFHLMRCLQLLPLAELNAEIVLLPLSQENCEAVARSFGATLIVPEDLELEETEPEFPEIQEELDRESRPPEQQGITLFFTGLSGSGKSTISQLVDARLREQGGRRVTSLDGDIVRKTLSSGLGFSREDRNRNILRIGWVAGEVNKHGGIAICAPIAPYDAIRKQVRAMSAAYGAFILIHVATPLEVCEARDRKGLYAKARAGLIKEFTGISDPYEEPLDAELVLHTTTLSAAEAADSVLSYLAEQGYL